MVIALVCFAGSVDAQARTSAEAGPVDEAQTLRALLTEVRELRLALQRATLSTTRFQLAAERLRAQLALISVLTRDLKEVRMDLYSIKKGAADLNARVEEGKERLSQAMEEKRRTELEEFLKELKREAAALAQRVDDLQVREGELNAQLQTEQGKLDEINRQIDALQKELEMQATGVKE
jgi:predicted  nucleic acid-binding Zn-ribbon protein